MQDLVQELWHELSDFPGYAVSDLGRVRNVDFDRFKVPSQNQAGVMHVMLSRSLRQYRRAVAGLVADAFLDSPPREDFNTIIHLDGDRTNCAALNLMWRPRWFTIQYHRQFQPGAKRGFREPVKELTTGEEFETSWDAAIKYGLIDHEIFVATFNRTYVFPTGQQFRVLDI